MACSETQVGDSIIKYNPKEQHLPRNEGQNQNADKS